ncbi:MAG: MMPL family transporter [Planctomycetaceae bacterium]|nr:MMPL family transporter [Planctomycetaceae bacterium]
MYDRLASFVTRHWLVVMLSWFVLAIGINWLAPAWDDITHDGDLAYMPGRMTSVRGEQLLARAFPENKSKGQVVLVLERPGGALRPEDYRVADRLAEQLQPDAHPDLGIIEVWTRNSEVVGDKLTSPVTAKYGQATLVPLLLSNEFMATKNIEVVDAVQQAFAAERARPDFPAGLELGITGSAAIGGDMLGSAKESIKNTELTTVVLVVVFLLLVYRAPLLMVIPLSAIILSVAISMDVVALLADYSNHADWLDFKVFKTTKIFIVSILFGSGTDFCLFLIARYQEELKRGLERTAAIQRTLAQTGDALVASALTTVIGLGMMYFADFGKFSYSGPTIALCLMFTLAACLTLAPAMLQAAGRFAFWPFKDPTRGDAGSSAPASEPVAPGRMDRLWDKSSTLVVRHPGLILILAVALMAIPAYEGLHVPLSYNLLNDLQDDRPSVVGTDMLRRHFSPGDIGPLTIVVRQPQAGFDTKPGEQNIALLTKALSEIDGVDTVRSYAEPLGDPPGLFNPLSQRGRRKMAAKRHPQTKATYLSQVPEFQGDVTRFDVVMKCDPFSLAALDVLNRVDARLKEIQHEPDSPWKNAEFDFVGTTAGKRDLQAVTESDQVVIMQLTVIAVYAVILVMLRRPIISIYLIISDVASYLMTIGLTEMFFGWLYRDTYEGLDWKVPLFLFVILVAVGEDYNIYLVTRVFEEQKRHGRLEGLRRGLAQTGAIITSCGVIMAGTFMSMMTGTLRGMLELGFALTLGILLDTFLVRTILVPAAMALAYRFTAEPAPLSTRDDDEMSDDGPPRRTPSQKTPLEPAERVS